MDTNLILKLIRARFGEYKKSGDEIQVKCPFCILRRPGHDPDFKFKLYINVKKGVYNCFRCEVRGSLINLFPQLEAISLSSDKIIEESELKEKSLEKLPSGNVIGTNLVTNGTFDTDANRTKGGGATAWTIDVADSNKAEKGAGDAGDLSTAATIATVALDIYQVSFVATRTATITVGSVYSDSWCNFAAGNEPRNCRPLNSCRLNKVFARPHPAGVRG